MIALTQEESLLLLSEMTPEDWEQEKAILAAHEQMLREIRLHNFLIERAAPPLRKEADHD